MARPRSQPERALDDRDFALLEALQVAPRAPWELLGRALGIGARTARRRWEELREHGHAAISCTPGRVIDGAYVDLDCDRDRSEEVAHALARIPDVASVELISGGHDVQALLHSSSLARLREVLISEIARTPGVLRQRSAIITNIFRLGAEWRIGLLTAPQLALLAPARVLVRPSAPVPASAHALRAPLLELLTEDGRMTVAHLAARTGVAEASVRRALLALLVSGHLVLRCHVSGYAVGRPMSAVLRLTAPADQLTATAQAISALNVTRVCVGLAGGPSNLQAGFWLRRPADLIALEETITSRTPAVVTDRAVTLRTIKRMGHLIDADDRIIGSMPLPV
ncbi:AsnC family transcriptional regulator [Georgenia sp. AZ-5]|uniref:AsnC family transcriptional regulator n=1 Tax=Georgenia sp. AZ-5 TaxID=3367526 RepID=UPI003754948C